VGVLLEVFEINETEALDVVLTNEEEAAEALGRITRLPPDIKGRVTTGLAEQTST